MSVAEVVKLLVLYVCVHWFDLVRITGYVVSLIKNNRSHPNG